MALKSITSYHVNGGCIDLACSMDTFFVTIFIINSCLFTEKKRVHVMLESQLQVEELWCLLEVPSVRGVFRDCSFLELVANPSTIQNYFA